MGFDAVGIVELMARRGDFGRITNNVQLQFGLADDQRLLGAELLPEQNVVANSFEEENVELRSPIANAGTRYQPVQLKKGIMTSSLDVKLSYSDIGTELKAADYDAFIRMIKRSTGTPENLDRPALDAIADLTNLVERGGGLPLTKLNEKQRWDAFVDAQVQRVGDNGYSELIPLPNPAGQRVNATGDWENDDYDPLLDIYAIVDAAADKNYTINRIVAGRKVISVLCRNKQVRTAVNPERPGGRVQLADLNALLAQDEIPPIEEYNSTYQDQLTSKHYLKRDAMCFFCTTGRTVNIELPEDESPLILTNTLGYTAIGTPAGQTEPGRVLKSYAYDNKPPRIEVEGWQASFPVILDPNAVYVIKNINITGAVL